MCSCTQACLSTVNTILFHILLFMSIFSTYAIIVTTVTVFVFITVFVFKTVLVLFVFYLYVM